MKTKPELQKILESIEIYFLRFFKKIIGFTASYTALIAVIFYLIGAKYGG